MLLAMLLTAAPPATPQPAPAPISCAPIRNLTAAGPPPPVLVAERLETAPRRRTIFTVHRCRGGGGYRVERQDGGPPGEDASDVEWVPAAQCAALGGWVEAAARLALPAPMLRPRRSNDGPVRGTWFTLHISHAAGLGSVSSVELHILEPPGAAPNALSAWVRDGERRFQACRDQGHGGVGLAPMRAGR